MDRESKAISMSYDTLSIQIRIFWNITFYYFKAKPETLQIHVIV